MTLTSAACPLTDVIEDQTAQALGAWSRRTGSTGSGCRHGVRTRSPMTAGSSCAPSVSTSEVSRTVEVAPERFEIWLERFTANNPDGPQRIESVERFDHTPVVVVLVRRGGTRWPSWSTAAWWCTRSAAGTSSPGRRPAGGRSSGSPGARPTRPTPWSRRSLSTWPGSWRSRRRPRLAWSPGATRPSSESFSRTGGWRPGRPASPGAVRHT